MISAFEGATGGHPSWNVVNRYRCGKREMVLTVSVLVRILVAEILVQLLMSTRMEMPDESMEKGGELLIVHGD